MIILTAEAMDAGGGVLRTTRRIPDALWGTFTPAFQQGVRDELVDTLLHEARERDIALVVSPVLDERHEQEGIID